MTTRMSDEMATLVRDPTKMTAKELANAIDAALGKMLGDSISVHIDVARQISDRLRTPASRVTEGEVAHAIVCLETIVGGSHFGKAFSADEIIRVIQSLASRLGEMTQSRDDFISDNKRLIGEKMEAKSALQSTNARLEQARAALEQIKPHMTSDATWALLNRALAALKEPG